MSLEEKTRTLADILDGYGIYDSYDLEMLHDGKRIEGKILLLSLEDAKQAIYDEKEKMEQKLEVLFLEFPTLPALSLLGYIKEVIFGEETK